MFASVTHVQEAFPADGDVERGRAGCPHASRSLRLPDLAHERSHLTPGWTETFVFPLVP